MDDKSLIENILKSVDDAEKAKAKEKEYQSEEDICLQYSIAPENLHQICSASKSAKELNGGKFVLSGNTKVLDNGNIARAYCRAGELMVRCIEDAYKMLEFKVPITGEYLMATPEEGWSGAH